MKTIYQVRMIIKVFLLSLAVSSVLSLGESEIVTDKSEEDLQELAQFAVREIYGTSPNGHLPPVELLNVKKQVVSGINYYLTLSITFPDTSVHICVAIIYTQPWKGDRELLKSDCPSMVGEHRRQTDTVYEPVTATDPEIHRVAKYAVEHIERESSCFKDARLENVNNALVKDDALFSLDITICEWPFAKSGNKKQLPHPCDLPENLHDCHALVYTNDGIPEKLVSFSCSKC